MDKSSFSRNLLDGANNDLAERVNERLENITGVQAAEDPTPEEETVDKLPVVHRLVRFLKDTHTQSCLRTGA